MLSHCFFFPPASCWAPHMFALHVEISPAFMVARWRLCTEKRESDVKWPIKNNHHRKGQMPVREPFIISSCCVNICKINCKPANYQISSKQEAEGQRTHAHSHTHTHTQAPLVVSLAKYVFLKSVLYILSRRSSIQLLLLIFLSTVLFHWGC